MKLEQFKAGVWRQQYQYKSFQPTLVDQPWTWEDPGINILPEQATKALGELNAFSLIVPDIDLFIEMHVVKEAQTSSRIEGTQTGIDEVLLPEEQVAPEKRDDWREVRNYIDALTRRSRTWKSCRYRIGCSRRPMAFFCVVCGESISSRGSFVPARIGLADRV